MKSSLTTARTAFTLLVLLIASSSSTAELKGGLSVVYGNPPAPALKLETLNGAVLDIESLQGHVVVVNFWATWCPPCIEEMPALARMWKELNPEGLELIAVNAGEFEDKIKSFLEDFETPLEFPIVIDKTSETFKAWNALEGGLPMTYVVDKQGHLAYSARGGRPMDAEHIVELLRALLAQ